MEIRRRQYWIEPRLQQRIILQWGLLVLLSTIITYFVTTAFVVYQDKSEKGTYFYVQDVMGSDPVAVKRHQIALPVLVIAGSISFLVTCLAGIFFSHQLAGPIYRFRCAISETLEGNPPNEIVLRKRDALKDFAEELMKLIKKYPK